MKGKFLVVTEKSNVCMQGGFKTKEEAEIWMKTAYCGYYSEGCKVIPNPWIGTKYEKK